MRANSTSSNEIYANGYRLDGNYHTSDGIKTLRFLGSLSRDSDTFPHINYLSEICIPDGIFIPSRFKRIFVNDNQYGFPYITGSSILQIDPLRGSKILSERFTDNFNELVLLNKMILVTCSGTIGHTAYVNATFGNAVGSPDILRIVVDESKILSGYLYIFLKSPLGNALIQQKTYGGVIQHIEARHVFDLLVPRIGEELENTIHNLAEEASQLRVTANKLEAASKERFIVDVLGISSNEIQWEHTNEHAFAVDIAPLDFTHHRLDAFHYVGYVADANLTNIEWDCLGNLVIPVLPNRFQRPYVGKHGTSFLSGTDLYNYYPKPRLFLSPVMPQIDSYKVNVGTILVQRSGQRYGLFGRPVILQSHLSDAVISDDLIRIYPINPLDRGFIFIWLSTDFGRRMLLKQSHGTSMGKLSEQSIIDALVPACTEDIRHSFEAEVVKICELRDSANQLEDKAQELLLAELEWEPET